MRCELTDYEWNAIKPFRPNKPRGDAPCWQSALARKEGVIVWLIVALMGSNEGFVPDLIGDRALRYAVARVFHRHCIINPPRPVMTDATALILLPLGVQAPWPNMLLAASRSKLTPSRQRPEFYFCGIEDSCRQTARDLGCGRWKPRHGLPQSYFVTRETAEELVGGQNNPEDDAPWLVQASAA
jgi:hypothetical protein